MRHLAYHQLLPFHPPTRVRLKNPYSSTTAVTHQALSLSSQVHVNNHIRPERMQRAHQLQQIMNTLNSACKISLHFKC